LVEDTEDATDVQDVEADVQDAAADVEADAADAADAADVEADVEADVIDVTDVNLGSTTEDIVSERSEVDRQQLY
jgi:hypothetical protein